MSLVDLYKQHQPEIPRLLAEILTDEEHHADWLETQLEAISLTGLENYLAQQLRS